MAVKVADRIGTTIGELTLLEVVQIRPARGRFRCSCGAETEVVVGNWTSGNTTSCGCVHRLTVTRHGMTDTPLYRAWTGMRQRVTNADHYPTYADVGCDPRWETFEGFVANPPTVADGREFEPGLCLARVHDEGDYSPENARWRTKSENSREKKIPPPVTHCVHGHEYTEENTHYDRHRVRRCRTCARIRSRAFAAARR